MSPPTHTTQHVCDMLHTWHALDPGTSMVHVPGGGRVVMHPWWRHISPWFESQWASRPSKAAAVGNPMVAYFFYFTHSCRTSSCMHPQNKSCALADSRQLAPLRCRYMQLKCKGCAVPCSQKLAPLPPMGQEGIQKRARPPPPLGHAPPHGTPRRCESTSTARSPATQMPRRSPAQ